MEFHNKLPFEYECLDRYNINNVISSKVEITHDGYDEYGPESNLYDYHVLFYLDSKIYYVKFHREYWFHGKDEEEYYLDNQNIFNRCISDELTSMGYYYSDNCINLLNDKNKKPYNLKMLSFHSSNNSKKIMSLSNHSDISLHINDI